MRYHGRKLIIKPIAGRNRSATGESLSRHAALFNTLDGACWGVNPGLMPDCGCGSWLAIAPRLALPLATLVLVW
ncbi:hypothetical protein KCP74_11235 [Salmonella enterica subsp. enterica]|nr:hypothetical protein KCP74_11235 [Salmonella enterica subsp. enterica]